MAILSAVLMIPAVVLVTGGILHSIFNVSGFNDAIDFDHFVFHPLIIIGGMTATIVINVSQIYRSRMHRGGLDRNFQFSENWENLAIVLSAFFLMFVIALYLMAENFQVFAA